MKRREIEPHIGAVVGCYSVDLYCGHPRHHLDASERMFVLANGHSDVADYPTAYIGETRTGTLSEARKDGWYISRDEQRVLCPYHAKQVQR